MASLEELYNLGQGNTSTNTLLNKVTAAIAVKAHAITQEASPNQVRRDWALEALGGPDTDARRILNYVLAANAGATVEQIEGATDTAIQTNVDAAVDFFYPVA